MTADPLLEIHYRDPSEGWEGILVIDSLVDRAAIGGVRVASKVDATEVRRLARAMTLKNSVLALQMGGAKVGIRLDPASPGKLDALTRFFDHVRGICEDMYGFGPDLHTTDAELDEVARRIGLPSRMAGAAPTPDAFDRYHRALDLRVGPFRMGEVRTGIGAAASLERAARIMGLPSPLRVAILGFGAVGAGTAWSLVEHGHRIVAVADLAGTSRAAAGLDIAALLDARRGTLRTLAHGELARSVSHDPSPDAVLATDCDALVLAAQADALSIAHVDRVRAKLVVEGGNISVTEEARMKLHARGIPVVPDFIASGGAIAVACGIMKLGFVHDDAQALARRLGDHIADATERAFDAARERALPLREAALARVTAGA